MSLITETLVTWAAIAFLGRLYGYGWVVVGIVLVEVMRVALKVHA